MTKRRGDGNCRLPCHIYWTPPPNLTSFLIQFDLRLFRILELFLPREVTCKRIVYLFEKIYFQSLFFVTSLLSEWLHCNARAPFSQHNGCLFQDGIKHVEGWGVVVSSCRKPMGVTSLAEPHKIEVIDRHSHIQPCTINVHTLQRHVYSQLLSHEHTPSLPPPPAAPPPTYHLV